MMLSQRRRARKAKADSQNLHCCTPSGRKSIQTLSYTEINRAENRTHIYYEVMKAIIYENSTDNLS